MTVRDQLPDQGPQKPRVGDWKAEGFQTPALEEQTRWSLRLQRSREGTGSFLIIFVRNLRTPAVPSGEVLDVVVSWYV